MYFLRTENYEGKTGRNSGSTRCGSNVKTACQDACPAYAIEFGNVNDKESTIAKYRTHELGYSVLEEIKVLPNVTYMAKLRNIYEPMHSDDKKHKSEEKKSEEKKTEEHK